MLAFELNLDLKIRESRIHIYIYINLGMLVSKFTVKYFLLVWDLNLVYLRFLVDVNSDVLPLQNT